MRSEAARAPLALKLAAAAALLFLHLPLLLIVVYAFTTEDKSYAFPPPGYTLRWFEVAWNRQDIWNALSLSVRVAAVSTLVALILGTLAAAAVSRSRFFGREAVSLLLILPIALPGIITGISLRSAFSLATSRSRSGRSCSAMRRSALWSSTTMRSRGSGGLPAR